jgi:hypothetical protein
MGINTKERLTVVMRFVPEEPKNHVREMASRTINGIVVPKAGITY